MQPGTTFTPRDVDDWGSWKRFYVYEYLGDRHAAQIRFDQFYNDDLKPRIKEQYAIIDHCCMLYEERCQEQQCSDLSCCEDM